MIEPVLPSLLFVLSALPPMGFDVTVAETFHDAMAVLLAREPMLLVTDLRLGEYNGLHLVLRGKERWPDLRAMVVTDRPDTALEREAERAGATFVPMPLTRPEFEAAVCRTMLVCRTERGLTTPVRPPFERRRGEQRTATGAFAVERRVRDRRTDAAARLQELALAFGGVRRVGWP